MQVCTDLDRTGRQERGVEAVDVMGHVGHGGAGLAVVQVGQRIAKLQIQVDQQHRMLARQRPAQVGGQEGGPRPTLARQKRQGLALKTVGQAVLHFRGDALHGINQRLQRGGRGQDLTHPGPHRLQQEFRRLLRAQQHHCHARVACRDLLHGREIVGIAAHTIDHHQVGLLLLGHRRHARLAALEHLHLVQPLLQRMGHRLQVLGAGGDDGDFHAEAPSFRTPNTRRHCSGPCPWLRVADRWRSWAWR